MNMKRGRREIEKIEITIEKRSYQDNKNIGMLFFLCNQLIEYR